MCCVILFGIINYFDSKVVLLHDSIAIRSVFLFHFLNEELLISDSLFMRANMLYIVLFDNRKLFSKSIYIELEHPVLIRDIRALIFQFLNRA